MRAPIGLAQIDRRLPLIPRGRGTPFQARRQSLPVTGREPMRDGQHAGRGIGKGLREQVFAGTQIRTPVETGARQRDIAQERLVIGHLDILAHPRPLFVDAEATRGLAPEIPRLDEMLEQRRGGETRLAELQIELLLDRE